MNNFKKFYSKHRQKIGRLVAWNDCHNKFKSGCSNWEKALYLWIYLAQWGMIRGSSNLLWYNWRVLELIVKVLDKYKSYQDCSFTDIKNNKKYVHDMLELKSDLRQKFQEFGISPTDTLLTKCILGTLCSVFAFDRYAKKGLKRVRKMEKFNKKTLSSLSYSDILLHKKIKQAKCELIKQKQINRNHPYFKIVDRCLIELGGFKNKKKVLM